MIPPRHNWFTLLLVSFGCAFLFAYVFVHVMHWTLPPSDLAYGGPVFGDPMVFRVMSTMAAFCALLVYPGVFWVLRRRKLRHCLPVLVGVVLAEILIITPFASALGFLGSLPAFAVGLFLCSQLFPKYVPPGCCPACGYPIGVSPVCTECGKPVKPRSTPSPSGRGLA